MRDEGGPFFLRDGDEVLADERSREGGAEGILPFVHRVGLEPREDELLRELAARVDHVGLRPEAPGFLPDPVEVSRLSDVDRQRDDVHPSILEPPNGDGGVQASGIGQNHFIPRHGRPCPNQFLR